MNTEAFLQTLPMMGKGMFGIFFVIFILYLVIKGMNKLFK